MKNITKEIRMKNKKSVYHQVSDLVSWSSVPSPPWGGFGNKIMDTVSQPLLTKMRELSYEKLN